VEGPLTEAGRNALKVPFETVNVPKGTFEASPHAVLQVEPFSVNAVGAVLVPVYVPLKPIPIEPFGAIDWFQVRFVAVTVAEPVACAHVALQPGSVTRWPDGNANANVHPLTAVVPVFEMVTVAVKPPPPPQFDAL